MTTLRKVINAGATTKGSALTHEELDNNFLFTQSGTGAVARTVQDKERDIISVEDYTGADVAAKIQAAHDHVETNGGGTVWFPNPVYVVSSTLRLNVSKVKFRGTGNTTFDFSSLPASGIGINVTGQESGTAFANAPNGIEGINLIGPGDLTTAIAMYIHSSIEAGPSYTGYRDFHISGWDIGISLGDNAYLLTFDNLNIRVGGKCFYHASTFNSGERISFINSTLSGAQYGIHTVDPDDDIILTNTSIDTSLVAIYARGCEVAMTGGHIECLGQALDSASSGGSNCRVSFSGVRMIQVGSSGALPFLNAQADTFLTMIGGSINPDPATVTGIRMSANSKLVVLGMFQNYGATVDEFNGCARIFWPGGGASSLINSTSVDSITLTESTGTEWASYTPTVVTDVANQADSFTVLTIVNARYRRLGKSLEIGWTIAGTFKAIVASEIRVTLPAGLAAKHSNQYDPARVVKDGTQVLGFCRHTTNGYGSSFQGPTWSSGGTFSVSMTSVIEVA